LGDPISNSYRIGVRTVRIQESNPNFSAIPGVDGARAVHNGDAVPRGKPAARNDEPHIAIREGDGNPGPHGGALAWAKLNRFRGGQIRTGVSRVRVFRRVVSHEKHIHIVDHVSRLVQCMAESLVE